MTLPEPKPDWAIFLDFDGTLAPIAPTPDQVKIDDRLMVILSNLRGTFGNAVALVSGRPISQLDQFIAPLQLPIAALHGLKRRRADGTLDGRHSLEDAVAPMLPPLQEVADQHPELVLEDKGLSFALHYRQKPELEDLCREAAEEACVAGGAEFHLLWGNMVFEIKPRDVNKGKAIEAFMEEEPFKGRIPVFAGDDTTDEDGFEMVNDLGGISIRVGEDDRTTLAKYRVPAVDDLLDWLQSVPVSCPDIGAAGK